MFARLRSLWRNLVHRDRVDEDLEAEVRAVFDELVDEKVAAGLRPDEARRAATLELGRVDVLTEQVRDVRAGAWVEMFVRDLRYGLRMLRSTPGFTVVVVLSLAVGIGANTAMFSVANALLLRSLPVPSPDTLFQVRYSRPETAPRFSYPFFEEARAAYPDTDGLAAMSRVTRVQAQVGDAATPEAVNLQLVSGEFFGVLGLGPVAGRLLGPGDNREVGGHPVVVVSDAFWRRRLGASPDAIGSRVTLNTVPFTIIGVAPPAFSGVWLETPADAWAPLTMQGDLRYIQNFGSTGASDIQKPWVLQDSLTWIELIVRAERPDAAEAAALNQVYRPRVLREAEEAADATERRRILDRHLVIAPFATGSSGLRDRFQTPLVALMVMVGLLLLVACVNTANLLLARAASRQREVALRLSIGASRARVMGQLLTESLLLALLAATAGLAIAPLASDALVRMTIGVESGPLPFDVGIDARVLVFTAAITLATSVLFGFAPAWRATSLPLATALKAQGRGTRTGARLNLAKGLVVAQVALSLLLVVGAGLFLRSFGNLVSQPLGFVPEHVISISINPSAGGFQEAALPALYRRLIDRVEAVPGVQAAALAMCGLMTGCRSDVGGLAADGYQPTPGEQGRAQINRVGTRYFATVGIPLVAGRDFTAADSNPGVRVAIVNESLARRYFKDGDAVGKRFGFDTPDTEIVGVVRDARVVSVREPVIPMVFFPLDATPSFLGTLHVRATGAPDALGGTLRRALQEAEPQLPIGGVTSVSVLAANTLRQERLIARLTTLLGAVALGLACLGLYGLMSYAVKQRTGELGIRFALGAPRARVLWMVFGESLILAVAGVAVGLPAVLAAAQLVSGLLFEIPPTDPLTIAVASLLLLSVAAAAAYLPAFRASRVDPVIALRQE